MAAGSPARPSIGTEHRLEIRRFGRSASRPDGDADRLKGLRRKAIAGVISVIAERHRDRHVAGREARKIDVAGVLGDAAGAAPARIAKAGAGAGEIRRVVVRRVEADGDRRRSDRRGPYVSDTGSKPRPPARRQVRSPPFPARPASLPSWRRRRSMLRRSRRAGILCVFHGLLPPFDDHRTPFSPGLKCPSPEIAKGDFGLS